MTSRVMKGKNEDEKNMKENEKRKRKQINTNRIVNTQTLGLSFHCAILKEKNTEDLKIAYRKKRTMIIILKYKH